MSEPSIIARFTACATANTPEREFLVLESALSGTWDSIFEVRAAQPGVKLNDGSDSYQTGVLYLALKMASLQVYVNLEDLPNGYIKTLGPRS